MEMNKNKNEHAMANHVHHHGSMKHMDEGYGDEMPNHGHMMMMEMQPHSRGFSLMTDSDFLIEGINIACIEGIILAMVFTMVVTIIHDMLKVVLHRWGYQTADKMVDKKKQNIVLIVKTLIHLTSVFLGYITMLCVMTMNVWLIISVVFGSGIAHLLIRPYLYTKLRINSSKKKGDNVKEEVKLIQNGFEYSTEKKQCCKTASTPLIVYTNNV